MSFQENFDSFGLLTLFLLCADLSSVRHADHVTCQSHLVLHCSPEHLRLCLLRTGVILRNVVLLAFPASQFCPHIWYIWMRS